jgi:Flp pilus assembly protein TadD
LALAVFLLLPLGATAMPARAAAQAVADSAAWAQAADLERSGRFAEAARALESLETQYPDEYDVALQRGWLLFRAEDWPRARRAYLHALKLSGYSSIAARLGLGWTQLRLDRPELARRHFERVLRDAPTNAAARDGLAAVEAREPRAARGSATVLTSEQIYVNHPTLRTAFALAASARSLVGEHLLLGATYRYLSYDASGQSPPWVASTNGTQHQAHATIGYVSERFALRLHGALIFDAHDSSLPAYTVGLSGWLAALGDVDLEVGATLFADVLALRALGSWDISLADGLWLGPIASAQYLEDGTLGGTLGARLNFQRERFAAALTARVGDESRAVYLNDALSYATTDRTLAAVLLSARSELGAGVSLAASYEWQHLGVAATTLTAARNADVHTLTAGVTAEW